MNLISNDPSCYNTGVISIPLFMAESPILYIYFDVGGVVIRDFSKTTKWQEMHDDLGLNQSQRAGLSELFMQHSHALCSHQTSLDAIMGEAAERFNIIFPDNYDMLSDFVDRFEKNPEIHPLISKASDMYDIGLLTNMYPGMLDAIKEKNILPDINWNHIIDSSIEGLSKPDKAIYELAQKRCGMQPEHILFIDNTKKNLDAAAECDWQTFLYDPSNIKSSNMQLEKILSP